MRITPRRLIHQSAHPADGRLQTDEDRLADQEMADIEFADMRDGGDRADIVIGQAVAGMDFQPQVGAELGGVDECA